MEKIGKMVRLVIGLGDGVLIEMDFDVGYSRCSNQKDVLDFGSGGVEYFCYFVFMFTRKINVQLGQVVYDGVKSLDIKFVDIK